MIVLAFVLAGVLVLLAGFAFVLAIGIMRRSADQVADADAAKTRALELLAEEQAARVAERDLYAAKLNGVYVAFRETVGMYRRTIEDMARWVTDEDEAPAPADKKQKRVM